MDYIKGAPRDQIILFPESVDDYIAEDNPVKFTDAFVDSLDLVKLGFKYSELKQTGRPPYDPADMLKLYIYGYLNRIRSSRRLEKEAARNLELIWLLKKLIPDYKTIANFRKDNLDPLRKTFREFTLVCKKLNLFGAELIAVDGSKFRAQNSKKKSFNKDKLNRSIKVMDEKIAGYMAELEYNDKLEESSKTPKAKELKEKIEALKTRKEERQELLKDLEVSGDTGVSLTDPDSRLMMSNQRFEVCYNVQMTVDAKHKLIVDYEVIDKGVDHGQLCEMATRAKEILETDNIEVLADKGYYDAKDIKACIDNGIIPTIPKPARNPAKGGGLFGKDQFAYDRSKDCYVCPGGRELEFKKTMPRNGKILRLYRTLYCQNCELKPACTETGNRTVYRWEYEHLLEEMQLRVETDKAKIRQRQQLSEHPFGTIKRGFDQGHLLLKRLKKVRGEFSLSVLAYNIKRTINILGVPGLVDAVNSA